MRDESETFGIEITVTLADLDSRGFGLWKEMVCMCICINVYALGPQGQSIMSLTGFAQQFYCYNL